MLLNPTKQELENRISKLFEHLNAADSQFDTAIIINRINQYYFTGTMQDGVLILKRNGSIFYFIRKSFQRGKEESPLPILHKISSYRDILEFIPSEMGSTFIETETMPLSYLDRLKKHFTMSEIHPIEPIISELRSIKSKYEIEVLTESGKNHRHLLEDIIPQILKEGMRETDFLTEIFSQGVKIGGQGLSRFSMFQMEMIVGQVGFGVNSLYPTNFDGPGGMRGMCPAVPIVGDRNTLLKKGDLVFVDAGFGLLGYHTDKTQVYSFGKNPDREVVKIHSGCIDVINRTADQLRGGNIPSKIYKDAMNTLPDVLSQHFMGYDESVKFLGHGIGLHVDEFPVIANGFNQPLQENMVIALEPKCGVENVGNVGVEETYLITSNGPVCLTGGPKEIIVV